MSSKAVKISESSEEEGDGEGGISGALGLNESSDAGLDDADYDIVDSEDELSDEVSCLCLRTLICVALRAYPMSMSFNF